MRLSNFSAILKSLLPFPFELLNLCKQGRKLASKGKSFQKGRRKIIMLLEQDVFLMFIAHANQAR
jgi:hypothetical protein